MIASNIPEVVQGTCRHVEYTPACTVYFLRAGLSHREKVETMRALRALHGPAAEIHLIGNEVAVLGGAKR